MKLPATVACLAALPALAWSQVETKPGAGDKADAGGAVALAELEGAIVESTVIRDQVSQRDGKQFSGRLRSDVTIVFGPAVSVYARQLLTWQGVGGVRRTVLAGASKLEQPRADKRLGGGHTLAVFSGGTLTYIRTYQKGAFVASYEFNRTPSGLSCTAKEGHAREEGAASIQQHSAFDDQPNAILSNTEVSSTCRVIPPKPGLDLQKAGAAWQSTTGSKNLDDLKSFIRAYPGTPYERAARMQLRTLRGRAPDERPMSLQELKRRAYDAVVADIKEAKLSTSNLLGTCTPYQPHAGTKAIYFQHIKAPKRLAACIAWERSSLDVAVVPYWRMTCSADADKALRPCQEKKGNLDCECQIVDIDGEPALGDAVLKKYFADYLQ